MIGLKLILSTFTNARDTFRKESSDPVIKGAELFNIEESLEDKPLIQYFGQLSEMPVQEELYT